MIGWLYVFAVIAWAIRSLDASGPWPETTRLWFVRVVSIIPSLYAGAVYWASDPSLAVAAGMLGMIVVRLAANYDTRDTPGLAFSGIMFAVACVI